MHEIVLNAVISAVLALAPWGLCWLRQRRPAEPTAPPPAIPETVIVPEVREAPVDPPAAPSALPPPVDLDTRLAALEAAHQAQVTQYAFHLGRTHSELERGFARLEAQLTALHEGRAPAEKS